MTTKYSITLKECKQLASGYEKIGQFRADHLKAFRYAQRKGWLEEVCANMRGQMPRGYMTIERCKN